MNKAAHENKEGDGPSVFRFNTRLLGNPKTAGTDSLTVVNVPARIGRKFPSRGVAKVEGTINGHPFRAALMPDTSGGHWLRVNNAMCKGAGADPGDTVKLVILGPEPEPPVPADLRAALSASHKAKILWRNLTPISRRDWVRWINSAKRPETRARRIRRTAESLSSGKRRPCCVNIYDFMLCRIHKSRSKSKQGRGK